MITLRISDLFSFEDIDEYKDQVQTDNPIYHEALKYMRYDVIMQLRLHPGSSVIKDFVKDLESNDTDKLTNRYYHRVLWTELVKRLEEDDDIDVSDIGLMKRKIIEDLNLPVPFNGNCYACCRLCKDCEIGKKCGKCQMSFSSYDKVYNAFLMNDVSVAIKYAREIRDAW